MSCALEKAIQTLAISKLQQMDLRTSYICIELGVTSTRCRGVRSEASGQRGIEKSASSILTSMLSVIEHTVLINTLDTILGGRDSADQAGELMQRMRPFMMPTAYSRYRQKIAEWEFFDQLLSAYPKHELLDINSAWAIMRDYVMGLSAYSVCANKNCGVKYMTHPGQVVSANCPLCYFDKRLKTPDQN